jgi:hypothetical protein
MYERPTGPLQHVEHPQSRVDELDNNYSHKNSTPVERLSPLVLDETRMQTASELESIRDMEESIWADSPLTNEALREKMRPLAHQSALKLLNLTHGITDQTYQHWYIVAFKGMVEKKVAS